MNRVTTYPDEVREQEPSSLMPLGAAELGPWDRELQRLASFPLAAIIAYLPPTYGVVEQAIEQSRELLEWEDNWDGEGSPSFRLSTWNRAAEFVRRNTTLLWRSHGRAFLAPEFLPVGNGSIDIEWQAADRTLIVTVPVNPEAPAFVYGHDAAGRNVIKGTLDTSANNEWLLMWALA